MENPRLCDAEEAGGLTDANVLRDRVIKKEVNLLYNTKYFITNHALRQMVGGAGLRNPFRSERLSKRSWWGKDA